MKTQELKEAKEEIFKKLDAIEQLVQDGFEAAERDSRKAVLDKAKNAIHELPINNATQVFADSAIARAIDEAGGPLDNLKKETMHRVENTIKDNLGIPRERIGFDFNLN